MLSLFVILMTVFSNVCAQDTSLPAFKVSTVVTDEKIVLATKNFPADTAYTVSMASPDEPEVFTAVAKFNSKTGGSLNVTVKIPEKFQGLNTIELMLRDDKGGKILGNFVNDPNAAAPEEPAIAEAIPEEAPAEEPAAEEPFGESEPTDLITLTNQEPSEAEAPAEEEKALEPISLLNEVMPAEEPAAEEAAAQEPVIQEPAAQEPAAETVQPTEIPVLVCNFAIIPTVKINAVQKNESVTFTTTNFPANSTFSVSMGEYVQTWVPDMRPVAPMPPMPRPHHTTSDKGDKSKHDHFYPMPAPAPRGHYTSTFKGTEVGTFETGSGESQTLTFEIPAEVKNYGTIAIWIQDLGPCGFYSYNYFFNNTVN